MVDNTQQIYEEERSPNVFVTIFRALVIALFFPVRLLIRFFKLLNELRAVILGFITFLFILLIALIVILIFKPPFFWDPIKVYLNADLNNLVTQDVKESDIYNKINLSTDNNGYVELTEDEIVYLFRMFGVLNEKSTIGLKQDKLIMYINTENSDKPLWLFVESTVDERGNLNVSKSGFGRFMLPDFISSSVSKGFGGVLDFLGRQSKNSGMVILFNQVLDQKRVFQDLTLSNVILKDGKAVLLFVIL